RGRRSRRRHRRRDRGCPGRRRRGATHDLGHRCRPPHLERRRAGAGESPHPARQAGGHAPGPPPAPTKQSVMVHPGCFVLHPAVLPPLPAGTYPLQGEIEDVPVGPVAPLDSTITVSSPRWTMPPDQILSTFPPANSEGAYRATLPQIVLKRRTLPWERAVDAHELIP